MAVLLTRLTRLTDNTHVSEYRKEINMDFNFHHPIYIYYPDPTLWTLLFAEVNLRSNITQDMVGEN